MHFLDRFEPFFFEHGPKNWNAKRGVILRARDWTQTFLGFSKVASPQFLGATWKFKSWVFLGHPRGGVLLSKSKHSNIFCQQMFSCFFASDPPVSKCFDAFLRRTILAANVFTPFCWQVVKLKVGGRATVYVGTTLKVRCPVKQYDKWVDFPMNCDDDFIWSGVR